MKRRKTKIFIGRNNTNDIIISNELVSDVHAIIYQLDKEQFKIQDLNSINGTFVNGSKINTAFITKNDEIKIASVKVNWNTIIELKNKTRKNKMLIFSILFFFLLVGGFFLILKSGKPFGFNFSNEKTQKAKNNFTELVAQAERSVFLIEAYNTYQQMTGTGTGFFIHHTGLAVSNLHIFNIGNRWNFKIYDGSLLELDTIIYQNKPHDIIIFRIKNKDNIKYPYLPLAQTPPKKGDDIFVVGNPKGIEGTLSKGVVSALRGVNVSEKKFIKGDAYIQIDAAISEGSSGSPVMNMRGEVVGIATLKILECENCNFAINPKFIYPYLPDDINPEK